VTAALAGGLRGRKVSRRLFSVTRRHCSPKIPWVSEGDFPFSAHAAAGATETGFDNRETGSICAQKNHPHCDTRRVIWKAGREAARLASTRPAQTRRPPLIVEAGGKVEQAGHAIAARQATFASGPDECRVEEGEG